MPSARTGTGTGTGRPGGPLTLTVPSVDVRRAQLRAREAELSDAPLELLDVVLAAIEAGA